MSLSSTKDLGNLDIPPEEWLKKQFEHEFCEECGGDEHHHTAVPLMGNWFARCDYPADGHQHIVVRTYRVEYDKTHP
jgi:hypothetical protein